MHPQPQLIARVVTLVASVGLLLAIFGCVILLTRLADRSLAQVPVVDAGAQTLTEASTRAHFSAVSHPTGTWTAPAETRLRSRITTIVGDWTGSVPRKRPRPPLWGWTAASTCGPT